MLEAEAVIASDTPALSADASELPLVIDLDGTLLTTDTLYETLLDALRHKPLAAVTGLVKLSNGRAFLKAHLAALSPLNVDGWPVNKDFANYVEEQAASGRRIVLITAADKAVAEAVAARFPFIDEVIASDGRTNLKGQAKCERLAAMFPDGYVYAGDSNADLAVWRASRAAIVVNAAPSVLRSVERLGKPVAVFPRRGVDLGTLRRALRLHQWAKNALVFVPLVLGNKAADPAAWAAALFGFVALGFAASATYLMNDLWDLPDDRTHWSKHKRPMASGELSIRTALLIAVVGLGAGLALAAALGLAALGMLALYIAGTLAYSLGLKRFPILDVFVIASLFTLRLSLGIVLADVRISPWLLVFSMFLFLSLSMAKRHTEVLRLAERGLKAAAGRGYVAGDAPLTLGLGLAAMLGAVLILILYLIEDAFPRGFYANPVALWAIAPILFLFLGRIWLVAQRGELRDDPVAFALNDRVSLSLGLATVLVVAAAVAPV